MSFALENQVADLKNENQTYKEALVEVRECIDSLYNDESPRRLHPELAKFAGLIKVMDTVTLEALKKKAN